MQQSIVTPLSNWSQFYKDVYNIETDPISYKLPDFEFYLENEKTSHILAVAPKISPVQTWEKAGKMFPCEFIEGGIQYLDESFLNSDRIAKDNGYCIVMRAFPQEGSAENIPFKATTLHEQLLAHLEYFYRTGKHADTANLTICPGSNSGQVPALYWNGKSLLLSWHGTNCTYNVARVLSE